jgi:hypothetical protein
MSICLGCSNPRERPVKEGMKVHTHHLLLITMCYLLNNRLTNATPLDKLLTSITPLNTAAAAQACVTLHTKLLLLLTNVTPLNKL